MVGLRQDGETVTLQAVDEPELPERLAAIELLREDAARERPELVLATWRRQRREANVVVKVEMRVVDPLRPPLAERHERELLPVARDEMQPPPDALDELVVVGRAAREQHRARDVHVGRSVLEVQERGVLGAEPVGDSHGACW